MKKIKNVITSPELKNINLGSYTEKLMNTFFEERIFSDYAKNVICKEAEDAFKNCVDDYTIIGLWQGEFWGKWIISACEVYKYTQDAELLDFIRKSAAKIMSYQREDGYIGTYKNSENVFCPDTAVTEKIVGWKCNWNWNIWCRKYTLWGLLECYEVTKDETILNSAKHHVLHLISELKKLGVSLEDTGTFNGLPSCSILKPMLILYNYTDDPLFYEFSKGIADNWSRNDGKIPNLITNALSEKRISEWYPDSDKWAKAYEMMSCFEGLIELYRFTGNEEFLEASEKFYDILIKYELNPVFSVAYNDVFGDAADEINAISEPCDAIHFMRICYELNLVIGDPKYMDTFEHTFYNAFLASVFKDGRWGARGVRSAGRHLISFVQAKFTHNHCCVNNMPRAFMTMASAAVTQKGNDVVINLYEDMTAKLNNADVKISGSYFANGEATVDVDFFDSASNIVLRIPHWSEKTTVNYGDTVLNAPCGYFKIENSNKKVSIKIKFDVKPVIHKFEKQIPQHTDSAIDWKLNRWLNAGESRTTKKAFLNEKRSTITYGPLLLSRSKLVGNTEKEMFEPEFILGNDAKCTATVVPCDDVRIKFQLKFTDKNDSYETVACDYASAGNAILGDEYYFSIYF